MLVILLLILANGLFAMSEIAIVSARKIRLQQQAEEGDSGARTALALANDPGNFLSTVQIGITLVGIFAGAFGGATLATQLEPYLQGLPLIGPYSQQASVVVVVVLITYLSLVIGELVPKRIGLNNAEGIAARVAPSMRLLSRIASPLVALLSLSTDLIVRLLRVRASDEPAVTEEEIRMMIEQGTELGIFEPREEELVGQVFRLADQRINALITPRPEIISIDINDPTEEITQKLISSGHSRLPVTDGNLDNVIGFVLAKDILTQCLRDQPLDLHQILEPPLFVPEAMPALEVLDRFQSGRTKTALVLDEYGGLNGLATLNDIMSAIVGEVPDRHDKPEPEVVRREDGTWLLDGLLAIDQFKDLFDIDDLEDDRERYFQTLGGFVMTTLGHLPVSGDHFEWGQLRFEVVDMDGRRVDKVLVTPLSPPVESDEVAD
jgi:putative hemolysin